MIAAALAALPAMILALPGGAYIVAAWDFVTSRLGSTLIVGAVAFAGGYHVKARLDTSAALQSRIVRLQLQLTAEQKAAADAKARVGQVDGLIEQLKQRNADYAQELALRPDGRCSLTDADIVRLRNGAGRRR